MQPPPDGSYPNQGDRSRPDAGYPQQGGQYPAGGYGYPQNPPPQQGYQTGYPQGPGYPQPGYGYQPPPPRGVASRGWFWLTLAGVVVIAAAVISTLVVTSGGGGGTPSGQGSNGPTGTTSSSDTSSPSDTTTPTDTISSSDTSSPSDTSSSSADAGSSSAQTSGGQIGRTYDVNGDQTGEKLAITLVAVDQNAKSTNEYEKPQAGDHFVATEYRIRNIGSTRYDDAVDNCVEVYDDQNSKYDITIVQSISSGNVIDEVGLAPGQSIEGWLVYALPTGKSIASTTYTPDSAVADTTVKWTVG